MSTPIEIGLIIIAPIFTGIGYIIKHLFTNSLENRNIINRKKLEDIENKLNKFYFPIYTNLLRENTIWDKILSTYTHKNVTFVEELDKEILSIHLENQKIIHDNLISINPSNELLELVIQYDEHVTIYSIIRKIDNAVQYVDDIKFPGHFGSPYPINLLPYITKEVELLREYQKKMYSSGI